MIVPLQHHLVPLPLTPHAENLPLQLSDATGVHAVLHLLLLVGESFLRFPLPRLLCSLLLLEFALLLSLKIC